MKGGRDIPPNYMNQTPIDDDNMDIDDNMNIDEEQTYPRLNALGFDDDELEALFMDRGDLTEDLINLYLQVARSRPYCQYWQTEADAADAAYEINVERYPGRNYEKRDIAKYVYGLISNNEQPELEPCESIQGGYKRKNKRTRKTKRKRSNKRKYSRRRRTRHRRRN